VSLIRTCHVRDFIFIFQSLLGVYLNIFLFLFPFFSVFIHVEETSPILCTSHLTIKQWVHELTSRLVDEHPT
jgi:hypothetical protein